MANIAGVAGDSEAVVAAAEEALSTFRALGDLPNAIDCLNALGGAAMRSGDLASARARFEEVEGLASQIGDTFRLEAALENLGNVALYEGHYDRAQRLFEEGLELTRELALPEATAHAILNSGLTALLMTDYVRAESLFQEGLELAAATGSVADVVYGCAGLAAALAGRAEWNNAVKLFAAADRIGTSIGLELEVLERRVHDRALALARSNLPADDFDSAWAAGEAMEVEELVSL